MYQEFSTLIEYAEYSNMSMIRNNYQFIVTVLEISRSDHRHKYYYFLMFLIESKFVEHEFVHDMKYHAKKFNNIIIKIIKEFLS